MIKNRKDYIADMCYARGVMLEQGKLVDGLTRHINSLLAIYPNKETRMDLHELYLKQSEEAIYPLYATKEEIFMIQVYGRVPERDDPRYKTYVDDYRRDQPFS